MVDLAVMVLDVAYWPLIIGAGIMAVMIAVGGTLQIHVTHLAMTQHERMPPAPPMPKS